MKLNAKSVTGPKAQDKLIFNVGSLLTINGLLLLIAPEEFVTLRQSTWLPDPVNESIDRLGRNGPLGRQAGVVATALGIGLLLVSVKRARSLT